MNNYIKALEYLNKNLLQNIPAITSINREVADIILLDERGIIIYDRFCKIYMISANDNSLLENLDKVIKLENTAIIALREINIDYIEKFKKPLRLVPCYQVIYKGQPFKDIDRSDLLIKALDISYFNFVYDTYSLKLDKSYIEDRLKSGEIYGAFKNGVLTGFIGRHDDGSMGILEILPEFRRQGMATSLQKHLINVVLASGEIPYAHIKVINTASIELQRNFHGIEFADEKIAWIVYE